MLVQVKFSNSSVGGGKLLSARVISTWYNGASVRGGFDYNLEPIGNAKCIVAKLLQKLAVKEEGPVMKFSYIATPDGYIFTGESSAASNTIFSL